MISNQGQCLASLDSTCSVTAMAKYANVITDSTV